MRVILLIVCLVGIAGCGPPDRTQLVNDVLAADPAFQAILEQHDEYANQIETAERELALKQTTIQQAIRTLRQDLTESRRAVQKKKAHYKELLEPARRPLALAFSIATEQLRAKRAERASVQRSIAQLQKALREGDEVVSAAERKRRTAQRDEMRRDVKRLEQEFATLQEHLQLLKRKLLLLRL